MSRQHSTPYIIKEGKIYQLQPVAGIFDEDWLQKFIFTHHQTIPLNEKGGADRPKELRRALTQKV